jgi:WhiB family redox-sensing transcriptional regulator
VRRPPTALTDPDPASELLAAFRPPAWMRDAACLETPDVDFFPDAHQHTAAARAVCARCLVRTDCLTYAREHNITIGIWGGLGPTERRRPRFPTETAPRTRDGRARG